jgi:hypothetical protein
LALNLKLETEKNKTVALQTLTESHTSQNTSYDGDILSLQGRLDIEEDKIDALQSLTESNTCQITSNGDLFALQGRLDTEEPKLADLETLTASHTTDIAINTADILTKQDLITSSTDLNINSIITGNIVLASEKF